MSIINVDDLQVGMVFAKDVIDKNGRLLAKEDVTLSEKHLRILKMWGVTEAEIKGVSGEDAEEQSKKQIDPELFKLAAVGLKKTFSYSDLKHEAVRELFRYCLVQEARKLEKKKGKLKTEAEDADDKPAERTGAIKKLVVNRDDLVNRIKELPALPDIYYQLNEAVNDPRSSAKDMTAIISKDPGLSTKLLKLSNSAYYSFRSRIETIVDAVIAIGTKEICTIAIGMTFVNYFNSIPSDMIDMKSFWKHSIGCGIAARILAGHTGVKNRERVFVGGLIHDIGRLVLFMYHPVPASETLYLARESNRLLYDAENEVMNLRHTIVGKLLLKKWKLPVTMENMVTYHHNPNSSQNPLEPSIIHLADVIVNALQIGTSGERLVPRLAPEAWQCLGLSKSIIVPTIQQIERQLNEVIRFFINE